VLHEFDRVIGLDSLNLFHLNDSKKSLGSRVDRHEHPGKGRMGWTVFQTLLNDRRFRGHAFLIETPKEKDPSGRDMDDVNLEKLRNLIKEKDGRDCI
jgi:deoxyribonuclease-4